MPIHLPPLTRRRFLAGTLAAGAGSLPLGEHHGADRARLAARSRAECRKVMPAGKDLGNREQEVRLEGGPNPPGKALRERIANPAAEEAIAVAAGGGVEARVKLRVDELGILHDELERQAGVEGVPQSSRSVRPIKIGGSDLPGSMRACVGAPCQQGEGVGGGVCVGVEVGVAV